LQNSMTTSRVTIRNSVKTSSTPRVALYARVSTNKQDAENQLYQLRQFSPSPPRVEYVDVDSGARRDRPEFTRMMEDARRRRFDHLLFWSLDRLSREGAARTLEILTALSSFGAELRSYTEQFLDSVGIFKEAVISILAVVAKQERVRLSERTRAGLEKARKEGKTLGRPRRVVDARVCRELVDAGRSVRSIAREFGISPQTVTRRLQTSNSAPAANIPAASRS